MTFAQMLERHADQIIEVWSQRVVEAIASGSTPKLQLVNDLPDLIREIAAAAYEQEAGNGDGAIPGSIPSARSHGQQRQQVGFDISGLAREFGVVYDAVVTVAGRHRVPLSLRDHHLLSSFLFRAAAESVDSYVRVRDEEVARQAAGHFAFVAHELRNPLQTAVISLETLQMQVGEDDPDLQRIQRAHARLQDLIDGWLVGARMQFNAQPRYESLSSRTLADAVLSDTAPQARRGKVEVADECDDFEFEADLRLMLSAVTNLVRNGIKFSPPGGRVALRARSAEGRALIEIEDTCGGLAEGEMEKLFTPFEQHSKDRSGFGLGLKIARQAVEAHLGSLRVTNLPGRGCVFVLDLPLQPPATEEEAEISRELPVP